MQFTFKNDHRNSTCGTTDFDCSRPLLQMSYRLQARDRGPGRTCKIWWVVPPKTATTPPRLIPSTKDDGARVMFRDHNVLVSCLPRLWPPSLTVISGEIIYYPCAQSLYEHECGRRNTLNDLTDLGHVSVCRISS
jgi:hypothetical protein